jgi:hypothetical protein
MHRLLMHWDRLLLLLLIIQKEAARAHYSCFCVLLIMQATLFTFFAVFVYITATAMIVEREL